MASRHPALTKTTTATAGTGAYVLGTANLTTAHRTPKQAVADGSLTTGAIVHYLVRDTTVTGDASFEEGEGVYTDATNQISRTSAGVLDGSNGPGVLVSWPGSGQRDVYLLGIVAVMNSAGQFGAAGGITISGSNQSAGILTCRGTTHATPGYVLLNPSGGNVGIGTATPYSRLAVEGPSSDPSLTSLGSAVAALRSTSGVQLVLSGQQASPYTYSLQTRHNSVDGSSYPMALNPIGGNVGIGTTSPSHLLHVTRSDAATTSMLVENTNAAAQAVQIRLKSDSSTGRRVIARTAADATTSQIILGDSGNFTFAGAATPTNDVLVIVSGDVGIGTSTPGTKLHVSGSDAAIALTDTSPSRTWHMKAAADTFVLRDDTAAVDRITVNSWGSVGIGTTNPAGLEINVAVPETARGVDNIRLGTAGGAPRIIFEDASFTQWNIDNNAGVLRFFQPGVVRMSVDVNGNLFLGANATAGAGSPVGVIHLQNAGTITTDAPTDSCCLYAKDVSSSSELFVRDEAAVETQLSAHVAESDELGWRVPSEHPTPWVHHEQCEILGYHAIVDMWTLAREVERLSGKKIVF